MSNKNKTALTAEEYLKERSIDDKAFGYYGGEYTISELFNHFASLQTQEKDKEITKLNLDVLDIATKLNGKIKSQQKEIEELRAELESEKSLHKISLQHQSKSNVKVHKLQSQLEGQEKAHQLELQIIGDRYQSKIEEIEWLHKKSLESNDTITSLESQLSEVTKEGDELRKWDRD